MSLCLISARISAARTIQNTWSEKILEENNVRTIHQMAVE